MKKFINSPNTVVPDYLNGLVAAHPEILTLQANPRVLLRRDAGQHRKVGLVAGGGSGCEPLHTGFVGPGMLDAACPGEIFTSPVPDQIMSATRTVNTGAGVVHIVKNFTGEVMNFGIAQEILAFEDIHPVTVLVNDDCSIPDDDESAGRRGLGATVFVEKIAGAAAQRGDDIDTVVRIARCANDRARTFSIGLTSCIPPARGKPIYTMAEDEMDIGIGISGSPGREKVPIRSACEIAGILLDEVLDDLKPTDGCRILTLMSGLGGTPESELYILYGEVHQRLRTAGYDPAHALVGNYVTSLEQMGAALTVLELDDQMAELWQLPVHTSNLRWGM